MLRTPLYDWHTRHNARMVPFGGWEMPIHYTSISDEHHAVRNRAGLFDISHMGRLIFEGPDALSLIQHVYTNDASTMKPGQARYGLICQERGGVLDDILVYRLDPFWMMVVNASNRLKILEWIQQHQSGRKVTITDRTQDWGMIAVQGPSAPLLVDQFTGGRASQISYFYATQLANATGPQFSQTPIVSRTGYTGEDGFEIIVPGEELTALCNHLVELAQSGSGGEAFELKPCGLGSRDTLRLEAAMPLYGHELSEEINPFQAGLAWAVKLNKGEFVGREALAKLVNDTTLPRRVGLELSGKRSAREGTPVVAEGRPVGQVTSGTVTPTLNKPIAMAYVEPGCAEVGSHCAVDIRGRQEPAQVVRLPFYRRQKL